MGPVYERLGLTVGKILEKMEADERRQNYAADITYGTSKEMGFDFLRDRLRKAPPRKMDPRRSVAFFAPCRAPKNPSSAVIISLSSTKLTAS